MFDSYEDKLASAYRCYKPEMVKSVFPGEKAQANKIIRSLARIYDVSIVSSDAKAFYEILTTYSDAYIRIAVTQSPDRLIMASLQVKHPSLVKNKDIARRALAYITLNVKDNDFCIDTSEAVEKLNAFISIMVENELTSEDNEPIEDMYVNDEDYGYVEDKPIFTEGVRGSYEYLNKLKTLDGESLNWSRLGATTSKKVNGMIDKYKGEKVTGEVYGILYVSMYGTKNSQAIPQGFRR